MRNVVKMVPKALIFGLIVRTGTINYFFVLGLGTRFLLALLLVSNQWPYELRSYDLYEKSIEKSIGLWIIYIKASSNSACGMKSRWNCKSVQ